MVDDELGDHAQAAAVRFVYELAEVFARPVLRMDLAVVGDVVAVVLARRWVEWQQPDRVDPEILQIVEFLSDAAQVAGAIPVAIEEGPDMQLVDDRVFVP